MEELKSPYCLAFLTGIVSVLLSYIDNRINKQNRTSNDYLKLFIMISILTILVLFGYDYIGKINDMSLDKSQVILTGNPNF